MKVRQLDQALVLSEREREVLQINQKELLAKVNSLEDKNYNLVRDRSELDQKSRVLGSDLDALKEEREHFKRQTEFYIAESQNLKEHLQEYQKKNQELHVLVEELNGKSAAIEGHLEKSCEVVKQFVTNFLERTYHSEIIREVVSRKTRDIA